MSLLDQFKEPYVLMNKVRQPDGEGGVTTAWTDGARLDLAMRHDTTMEAVKAEAEGVKSTYTFLLPKSVALEYHDVLKRESDGQCFRITSNANDSKTPGTASFDLTSVTAEKWELT